MIRCGKVHRLDPDPDLVRFLTAYGGRSVYGDPLFRMVWSGNHGTWRFKKWTDRADSGAILRQVIEPRWSLAYRKPWQRERWIVERLVATLASPEEWREQACDVIDGVRTEPLGSYPSRGQYQLCDTVEDGGAFVQPTRAYLKAIVDRVGKHEFSDSEIYDFLVADEEAQSRRQEVRLLDAIKDATRPHLITPHAYMTGLTAPNYAQH